MDFAQEVHLASVEGFTLGSRDHWPKVGAVHLGVRAAFGLRNKDGGLNKMLTLVTVTRDGTVLGQELLDCQVDGGGSPVRHF